MATRDIPGRVFFANFHAKEKETAATRPLQREGTTPRQKISALTRCDEYMWSGLKSVVRKVINARNLRNTAKVSAKPCTLNIRRKTRVRYEFVFTYSARAPLLRKGIN